MKKILSWQEKTLRLVVTKTKINMQVVISSFSYGEEDGTGDIKYKLSLMEYRAPKYTKPKEKRHQRLQLPQQKEYKTGNETGKLQNESKGAYCFRKRYLVEYFQEILRNWIICEQDLRSKQDHYRADCSKTWIPQQCQ